MTTSNPPILLIHRLYITDNGAVLCGKHCGASARWTGRDISGQEVQPLTEAEAKEHGFRCEGCHPRGRRA